MWLVFALLAPLFFAIVHVLDEYCVDHVLEKPWMGIVTSSVASMIFYLTFPFFWPWVDFSSLSMQTILLALSAGIFIQVSQAFYFHALSYSDAGVVAAYWNLIPFILPIASFLIFGTLLTLPQYLGILLLIFSSTWMCVLDYHQETRFVTFALMFVAACFQVAAYLIMGQVYHQADFVTVYLFVTTGIVMTGLAPLLFPKPRAMFVSTLNRIVPAANFFVIIEIANLLALASAQFAISLGTASLVAAVETTVPAFVFLVSIFWVQIMNLRAKALWSNIPQKLLVISFMSFGVWLVS